MAYSIDFIKRAITYKQNGHTFAQLHKAFDIPSATYYDWEAKLNNGYFDIIVKRERHRKIDKEALIKAAHEKPDAFLKEYAEQFNCTSTAVFYALEKLNMTRKKRPSHILKSQKKSARSLPQG